MINPQNVKNYDLILKHLISISSLDVNEAAQNFCDGDINLAEAVASEFEDRSFAKIDSCREGDILTIKQNGKAANFFKNGGFTAELQAKQKALEEEIERKELEKQTYWLQIKNIKINEFLYRLQIKERHLAIEDDTEENHRIISELKRVGLIELEGAFYVLSEKGILLTERGDTYDNYLSSKKTPQPMVINNHSGNTIISSTITNSSLDITSPEHLTINNAVPREQKSLVEKLSWLIGIGAGLVAIYEFFIK